MGTFNSRKGREGKMKLENKLRLALFLVGCPIAFGLAVILLPPSTPIVVALIVVNVLAFVFGVVGSYLITCYIEK